MNKIRYFCFDDSENNGGSIYDNNFIRSLKSRGYRVSVIRLRRQRRITPPFWASRIDPNIIKNDVNDNFFNIISHEGLFEILRYIKCDLYILHNVFSIFEYINNPMLNAYFKINSDFVYKKILSSSSNALCLSYRDYLYLSDLKKNYNYDISLQVEPPGIYKIPQFANFDYSMVKLSGTNSWLPKKLSQLNSRQIYKLEKHYSLSYEDLSNIPSYALINEKFLSGFKLKLIQMLYRGDVIASFVDLKNEINHLGESNFNYKYVSSVEEAIHYFSSFDNESVTGHSRIVYEDKYNWVNIVDRILTRIV